MGLGFLAVLAALGAAGWLLVRLVRGGDAAAASTARETRNVTLFKGVVFLALVAALFAAKLWPLAFMPLHAAGGVTAIEVWRSRQIRAETAEAPPPAAAPTTQMDVAEAASVLGVEETASVDAVRAAHKRLIGKMHPDTGGSDYLAAKVNAAREVMIKAAGARGADNDP
ncbi:MAG: hypothetical protein AAGC56_14220 [Pseudomonadota bacterium]